LLVIYIFKNLYRYSPLLYKCSNDLHTSNIKKEQIIDIRVLEQKIQGKITINNPPQRLQEQYKRL
jgi:hypothetical protein